MTSIYILLAAVLIFILVLIKYIRIIPQSEQYVIERLGSYHATWGVGIHVMVPFIDRIANRISLKELVMNSNPQPVITKDNITMSIDTVLFFQITDAFAYTYGVNNPLAAIENLTTTTLRNIIGDLELDETLTSRDIINSKMRVSLDEAANAWGIKVLRVEVLPDDGMVLSYMPPLYTPPAGGVTGTAGTVETPTTVLLSTKPCPIHIEQIPVIAHILHGI